MLLMGKLRKWERLGIIFIPMIAVGLYYLYKVTGWGVFKIIMPVNNSPWEFLKVIFYATCIYTFIEYNALGRIYNNFLPSRFVTFAIEFLWLISALAIYTQALNIKYSIWINCGIAAFGLIICQWIGVKINYNINNLKRFSNLFWGYIIVMVILFTVFTFVHPETWLFTAG